VLGDRRLESLGELRPTDTAGQRDDAWISHRGGRPPRASGRASPRRTAQAGGR
jgi:hypothetical protein